MSSMFTPPLVIKNPLQNNLNKQLGKPFIAPGPDGRLQRFIQNPLGSLFPPIPYNPRPQTQKIGDLTFNTRGPVAKELGGILRYPLESLTNETDYLQIDIREYNSIRSLTGGLASSGSQREITTLRNVKDTAKETLSKTKIRSGKGTILLPMPSNIQDGNSVSYNTGNLDGITAKVFDAIVGATGSSKFGTKLNIADITKSLTDAAKDIGVATIFNDNFLNVIKTGLAAEAANIPLGGSLTRDAVFARVQGEIINQNVELLFNGVNLRSFKFSFKLTPRSPEEARQILFIINAFKKNMSPKLRGDKNFFLGTPNVFELAYKRGNVIHPFLHTFKQCVLTDMSVNYTGEGTYATYAGDEGAPVSTVLELGFKELEPIYDLDYDDNLPGVGY